MTEDLKTLTDADLFDRLSDAIRAIPLVSEADPEAWQRAWDDVRRYHNELGRRYRRSDTPTEDGSSSPRTRAST